jgi:4'-phosphopantetheinyl transferase
VLAAAAWDHEVGVDLERADAEPAAERDQAIAAVAGASGDDALEHWTRVEAVLKADGRGLRVDPSLVRIRTSEETVEAQISDDGASYALASIDLGPGFTATVAVRS